MGGARQGPLAAFLYLSSPQDHRDSLASSKINEPRNSKVGRTFPNAISAKLLPTSAKIGHLAIVAFVCFVRCLQRVKVEELL